MKFGAEKLLLYAVTDGEKDLSELEKKVELCLRGGATAVQLREKGIPYAEYVRRARALKEICSAYGAPLIVNDDIGVALEAGADGVHLGADDCGVFEARKIADGNKRGFIIGATAKTPEQAAAAQAAGADYLGVGAVFPSPTKAGAVRITVRQLAEICESVSIPAVAIGGITAENARTLYGSRAAGVAVVSAIFSGGDVLENTRKMYAAARYAAYGEEI